MEEEAGAEIIFVRFADNFVAGFQHRAKSGSS
jgi:hypothetical protein